MGKFSGKKLGEKVRVRGLGIMHIMVKLEFFNYLSVADTLGLLQFPTLIGSESY